MTHVPTVATRVLLALLPLAGMLPSATAADPTLEFNRDVRPILAEHCFRCHGPDGNQRKADLRLDLREQALAHEAIVPGKPEASKIVARIHAADLKDVMPPPSLQKPLSDAQRSTLESWIRSGADYQPHWAYVAPRRVAPPAVANAAWVRDPIDAFVLAKLEARGIAPSPEADDRTLLRRVSLDLVGLPPTADEADEYAADSGPAKYERAVDRLLASPHFGERWATFWLDVARYADTVGYHGDQNLHAFPYRDWVVDAFNADLPFDRFTIEQLAGDLLPDPTPSQLVATGFNRLNMVTREGGAQPGEYLAKYAADRVRTVAGAWLGSTLGCAECHDHKYDPFSTRDFYRLAAFFADVRQWGVYTDYPYTPNPDLAGFSNDHPFPPEITVEVPYLERRIATLRAREDAIAGSAVDRAADFEAWRAESVRFLARWPDGFATPAPEVLAPEGSTIGADARVVFAPASPNAAKIVVRPGAPRVASLRIELLPDAAHGGALLKGGADAAFLKIAVAARTASGETPLGFRLAEAERCRPMYSNGFALRGILGGWFFETRGSQQPARACLVLDHPLALSPDDALVVTLETGGAGAVRIGASPFAPESPLATRSIETLAGALAEPHPLQRPEVRAAWLRSAAFDATAFAEIAALDAKVQECDGGYAPTVVVQSAAPRVTRVLHRGNWQDETGEVVEPGVPRFLPQPAPGAGGEGRLTRLDLARWLVSPENPLTARVFVNRLWKQLLGSGIAPVVDDLGAQGDVPSHPEMLDELAIGFREAGFSMKALVRRIVTSAVYRQASCARPELREIDPANRLLACQNARRLDAEFVRDNALFAAGLLQLDLGGPPAMPWQPERLYEFLQFPDRDWHPDRDERQWRRGLYIHWQRTFLHPMLAAFDAPSREECTASRVIANTPQQALVLLNDPTFVEAARALAATVLREAPGSDAAAIDRAFRRALARPASSDEIASLERFVAAQRVHFERQPDAAAQLLAIGIAPDPAEVAPVELASWTLLCRVVLNLHECITRY